MTDLSPRAQAIVDAFNVGFNSPLAVHLKPRIAYTLRVLPDNVVPDLGYEANCLDEPVSAEIQSIRDNILSIATELEQI